MNRIALYLGIVATLMASCSIQEENYEIPEKDNVVFYASFEQPVDANTRVYANGDLSLRWTADDRVSIFNKNTYNQQYKFVGETGDDSGGFDKVGGSEFYTGKAIPDIISVYPYQSSIKVSESESITVTLPSEQIYAENTFGLGANTMVSVTSDNFLQYKNVGGYLRIRLYGERAMVSSIAVRGNNGEKLAGKATITMPLDGVPSVEMADDAKEEITLICEDPVSLESNAENSTDFWFVLPPVTFSKGFTISIKQSGSSFPKEVSTTKSISIARNKLSKMTPVKIEEVQPRNVIYYTSSDDRIITPSDENGFGANIVSNDYSDGKGIISFDGDVTAIGSWSFAYRSTLTSISIPESATIIGDGAFFSCTDLTEIGIPESVTTIGHEAFSYCSNLTEIRIPNSVNTIGDYAFFRCIDLNEIRIPESVTTIGDYAFYCCTNLTDIRIPDRVTTIGSFAFYGCNSLTDVTIPESVASIGDAAFSFCRSLIAFHGNFASSNGKLLICSNRIISSVCKIDDDELYIPEGVTSIGDNAFYFCWKLTHISLPDSVTSIGSHAFDNCQRLTSINIPEGITSISNSTFCCCLKLSSIIIPESVTRIENDAFIRCSSLTSITIPENVTYIGYGVFYNCSSLESVFVLPTVPPECNVVEPGLEPDFLSETNDCPIYVPWESVSSYKEAPYWSYYADRIHSMDENDILVTNPYVQTYLEEVTYTDTNYEITRILDYPGGGPGEADIPPAYTITWTADASVGDLELRVWQRDWSREYILPAGTTSQDLINLIPRRYYHYRVTAISSGNVIVEDSFKTRGLLHQVYFEPKGRNARDLGGWKGLNGKTVAFGKLYRGSAIHGSRTNSVGKAEMRAQGIKAEVDLREPEDVPSKSPLGDDITFFAPGFYSGYNSMVRDNPSKVKDTFCFIVQCLRENKPVYFHCAAGRDRTGTLAVLLLGALGVSESDMAKDYELTYFAPADWSMSTDSYGNLSYNHTRNNYSYPSIRKTIFNETDGGTYQERIVKYLLKIGVPQTDIDDYRALMLE